MLSQTIDRIRIVADGVATFFACAPLQIVDASDIEIYTETGERFTGIFRVDGVRKDYGPPQAANTFTLVFTEAPSAGPYTVIRRPRLTQLTQLHSVSKWEPKVIEAALDRIVAQISNNWHSLQRTVRGPLYEGVLTALPNAATRAGKYLAFDPFGNPIATANLDTDDGSSESVVGNTTQVAGIVVPFDVTAGRVQAAGVRAAGVVQQAYTNPFVLHLPQLQATDIGWFISLAEGYALQSADAVVSGMNVSFDKVAGQNIWQYTIPVAQEGFTFNPIVTVTGPTIGLQELALADATQASETESGLTRLATNTQVYTGTVIDRVVTTAGLQYKWDNPVVIELVDQETVAWALKNGVDYKLTTGGNRTMAAPTGGVNGSTYVLVIVQDATGNRVLTWDDAYKWGDAGAPTLSTRARAEDVLVFHYFNDEIRLVSINTGF